MIKYESNSDFCKKLDADDEIRDVKKLFNMPLNNPIYLCGHSLGLQPKQTKIYINNVIEDWSKHGVKGHMEGKSPWFDYHTLLTSSMSKNVGSKEEETVVMNSLTTN